MKYAVYDVSGRIHYVATSVPSAEGGLFITEVSDDVADDTHYIDGGVAVSYSAVARDAFLTPHGSGYQWNPALQQWDDLRQAEELRVDVLRRLRAKRDTLLEGGFTWDGSTFDSDTAVSQPRLLGLFTTAIAGGIPPSGYPWRLKDNTWRTLSAVDAQAVWAAFQAHMGGLFAAFAVHEAAVAALSGSDALRSYNVEAGWP